jgi:hypothetical protein
MGGGGGSMGVALKEGSGSPWRLRLAFSRFLRVLRAIVDAFYQAAAGLLSPSGSSSSAGTLSGARNSLRNAFILPGICCSSCERPSVMLMAWSMVSLGSAAICS